jgi:hypothetical protein
MAAIIGVVSPKSGGGYTAKIPLDLLSQDGVPPEQGDDVSFSVDATVKSVDAEDATVSITAVNGEPVNESAADEASEDDTGAGASGGPPQPGGQAGGLSGAGGRGGPVPKGVPLGGALSPSTLALGAALRKKARGQPMPF